SGAASGRPARARVGVPRPRRDPAPGRTCTRAGRSGRCGRARTRAGTLPRRTRGRHGGPVAATGGIDTTSAAASRADDDEVAALVQDVATAELGCELRAEEVALVDLPAGAVLEPTLLPCRGRRIVPAMRSAEDQLPGVAAR